MNSSFPVDAKARRIAGASSLVAACLAVFWIVQLVRGKAPRDDIFLLVNIFFLVGLAYMFGRMMRENQKIGVMPMLIALSSELRFAHNPLGKQNLGVAGVVTFVATVGLFAVDVALQYRRRKAAQPGVEPDGRLRGRGLTPDR